MASFRAWTAFSCPPQPGGGRGVAGEGGESRHAAKKTKKGLTGTAADLRGRQWRRRTKGREKGDDRPSAAAMVVRGSASCLVAFNIAASSGAPLRDLRLQLKGSFLLPLQPPTTHPNPTPPPSRLHAFTELSEQIPTIPAVEKPSLAPPEVASKKRKKALTNPHSALKRDTFCQTGEGEREREEWERERQSSEDMETLLRQNIAKIAGKKLDQYINMVREQRVRECVCAQSWWGKGGLH